MREELQNDYPALSQLKVGEISPSFQSYDGYGNVLNKIVKLIAIIPAHTANLSEDYTEIESLALQAKREEESRSGSTARSTASMSGSSRNSAMPISTTRTG